MKKTIGLLVGAFALASVAFADDSVANNTANPAAQQTEVSVDANTNAAAAAPAKPAKKHHKHLSKKSNNDATQPAQNTDANTSTQDVQPSTTDSQQQ